MTQNNWEPSAAYLYVLHLDAAGLAWEYLRRNPAYRETWHQSGTASCQAQQWGLSFLEDPDLDARQARPTWRIGARRTIELVPLPDPAAHVLDLWAIAGRKSLVDDGQRQWLYGECGRELVALTLSPDLQDGAPFAYAIPAGVEPARYRFTLEAALTLLQRARASTPAALARPSRTAMTHMRALQAIDGVHAGASQRRIATVLFGEAEITARWHPDSELRAQLRYLVRRGRGLMEGRYRALLA